MNFRSVADLDRDILRWLPSLPADIELVVGIPRSGMIPALLIALHRNLPVTDVQGLIDGRLMGAGLTKKMDGMGTGFLGQRRRILVVDDSILNGTQLRKVREELAPLAAQHDLRYAAVYIAPGRSGEVDFGAVELDQPRIFEWNVMHSLMVEQACLDIDGVLCRDPRTDENDDGDAYCRFLAETTPIVLPKRPARMLVTSRLEKYRRHTEEWLARHGVQYTELRMLDLPDAETRRRLGAHASFKAQVYKESDCRLFIESEPHQAQEIARVSGKYVLCWGDMRLYNPTTLGVAQRKGRSALRRLRSFLRRIGG